MRGDRRRGSRRDGDLDRFGELLRQRAEQAPHPEPPGDFAERVLRRLPAAGGHDATALLGWAALRLLPAGLALLLLSGLVAVEIERGALDREARNWVASAGWSEDAALEPGQSLTWLALTADAGVESAGGDAAPGAGEGRR